MVEFKVHKDPVTEAQIEVGDDAFSVEVKRPRASCPRRRRGTSSRASSKPTSMDRGPDKKRIAPDFIYLGLTND
jgi:hypothetical protein